MDIESQPLTNMQQQQDQYSAQVSAFGTLISAVSGFQTSMNALGSMSALDIFSTSSSNTDVIDITATDNPDTGSFSVEVNRVADYHKMTSAEVAATDTFGGNSGDAVSIQVGSSPDDVVTVDLTTAKTLEEISAAINADENNPGVHASIINGDGGTQKLVLTSEDTGSAHAMTLVYAGAIDSATLGLQTVNDIGGDTSLLDAEFVVDGLTVTRSSNTVDDVISGVTFSLAGAAPGETQTIKIARDTSSMGSLVQSFADAYNRLQSSIDSLRAGDLGADSALLTIENQLSNVLRTSATTGAYSVLSDVGLSLQKDGTMRLDSSVLSSALAKDSTSVSELFASEGDGFANRMSSLAGSWLEDNGLIESHTDGLNARINDLADSQASLESRLTTIEQRYWDQFTALDVLMGQLQSTSSYLTQQLAALPDLYLNKQ
jgi:flagellar hook-associated protein 2